MTKGNGNLTTDQEQKLRTKFGEWNNKTTLGWTFKQWNQWRRDDGLLCRTADDCKWLGGNIKCDEYQHFDWDKNNGWFNGEAVRGRCECQRWNTWESGDMSCRANPPPPKEDEGMNSTTLALLITAIVIFFILCIICMFICG